MGIIMSENIHRRIASASEQERREKGLVRLIFEGGAEVSGAIATAGSNTLVCFLPVFFLTDQEGKLFRPLAFTKTFAIGASIVLALSVVPFLCSLLFRPTPWTRERTAAVALLCGGLAALGAHAAFSWGLIDVGAGSGWLLAAAVGVGIALCVVRMTRERFVPLEENPVSRGIQRLYVPTLRWILEHKLAFLCLPLLIVVAGVGAWWSLGREFMPALNEGSFLYMPSLLPQGSLSQAIQVNSVQDRAIATVPEVESVVGKIGRVESALDPAPIGMMESIILLKAQEEWRQVAVPRFFSDWPAPLRAPLGWLWPEQRRITQSEILTELQERTAIPGVLPTFLQPIQTRLVMLQSGFRAMMGVKIYGSDLREIERIGLRIEQLLHEVPGATDIVADRIVGKPYIQIEIDRERMGRYGVNIRDVQDVIEMALGGLNLMESVEGRERYPIRVRLARDFREDAEAIERTSVPTASGAQVPLAQLASIRTVLGPQEIKGERGLLVGYVTLNTRDRDEVSVVEDAEAVLQQALREGRLQLPAGYYWEWSGQFENQVRAIARMRILVPLTLAILFAMLMLGFQRWWLALIIFSDVAVSTCAGFAMLALWDVNLSVAVWVGFLVLFGVVDDDSVVIATYLEQIFEGRSFQSIRELRAAVLEAGLRRIRPCLMTTATTVFGLLPIFWATGRGSDVMRPMAIPSMGGMAASLITMFIVPCLFCAVEEWNWQRRARGEGPAPSGAPGSGARP
jgi:Cu(I)/Ag(I) efflux system membrane protein CusA/SilA